MHSARQNLYGLDASKLAAVLADQVAKPFTGKQISRWLYRKGALSFEAMTDIPARLRLHLSERAAIARPSIAARFPSLDGTVRYLVDLPGGGQVESVAIVDRGRETFCISSQIGCALACTFCMTGTLGLVRHLSAGEIAGQVAALMQDRGLEANRFNIVLMGMGEPLHNYDNVVAAIRVLASSDGFAIGAKRITLSTAGMAPEIERLACEDVRPRLAVSLTATTDEARSRLVPINRRYPIARLREACRRWVQATGELVFLEYVLLAGENDSLEDAERLTRLARGIAQRINLIPFNETPVLPHRATPFGDVLSFRDELVRRGLKTSVRRSRGRDVAGACGMLAFDAGRSFAAHGPAAPAAQAAQEEGRP